MEELCFGVEVQQADGALRLRPLFGVLGNKHSGDWLATPICGSTCGSSVIGDETVSEATVFVGVLFGFLFLVFLTPPGRWFTVISVGVTSCMNSDRQPNTVHEVNNKTACMFTFHCGCGPLAVRSSLEFIG